MCSGNNLKGELVTITVNGKTERFNIGCRTFISVANLLSMLGVVAETRPAVHVNDTLINPAQYTVSTVRHGDRIIFESKYIR